MTLGGRIQLSRKKKGYSQEDLANLLDISRQSVQKWETDQSSPEITKLAKLSEVLDVSLDYLIKGEDDVVGVIEENDASVEPVIVATPQSVPTRTVDRNILYSFKYQSGGLLITPNNKKIDASFKIEGGTLYSRYNGFNWPFALLGIIFTPIAGILMGLFIPHKWNSQLSVSSIKGIQIYSDTIELTTYEGIYKFKPRDFSTWANFFNDFSHLLDPKLAKENELKLKKEQEVEAARMAAAAAEEARKEAERKRQLELRRKLDLMRAPRISKIQTLWNAFDNCEYTPEDKNKSHSKANQFINKIRTTSNEQQADGYVEEYRTFNKQFKINHRYYVKRKKRNKKIAWISLASVVVTALSIIGLSYGVKAGIKEKDYRDSLQFMYEGNYEAAKTSFGYTTGYKDTDTKVKVCDALIYLTEASNNSEYGIIKGINMIIDAGETVRLSYLVNNDIKKSFSNTSYSQEITSKNFTFKDPGTKLGYTISEWKISKVSYKDNHSYLTLAASWNLEYYQIHYNLDGGINNQHNPSHYTVEDSITLYNPTKNGFSFAGWFDAAGNKATGIKKGSIGSYTFYAHWNANSYRLTVLNSDSTKGTVEGSGTYKYKEIVTVKAISNPGYIFNGWYCENNLLSHNSNYSFQMPMRDYSLTANFIGEFDIILGISPIIENKIVKYGLYPQTYVSNELTIKLLESLAPIDEIGHYILNDEYYVKIIANPSNQDYYPKVKFDDGTIINTGDVYWFKCEPIAWDILHNEDGKYFVVSEKILDGHRYGENYSGFKEKNDYQGNSDLVLSGNYMFSDLRNFLNTSFFDKAFFLNNEHIITSDVDNSPSTSTRNDSEFSCSDTKDKIFALSFRDLMNPSYGFADSWDKNPSRDCKVTDYAKALGVVTKTNGENNDSGWYYTRTPAAYREQWIHCVSDGGWMFLASIDFAFGGIRPAMNVFIN